MAMSYETMTRKLERKYKVFVSIEKYWRIHNTPGRKLRIGYYLYIEDFIAEDFSDYEKFELKVKALLE